MNSLGGASVEAIQRNAISRKPGAYIKDPVRYKTQMCQNFTTRGKCPYNKKCQFAHGAEELRSRSVFETCGASREVAAPAPAMPPLPPPPPPPPLPPHHALPQPPLPPPSQVLPHPHVLSWSAPNAAPPQPVTHVMQPAPPAQAPPLPQTSSSQQVNALLAAQAAIVREPPQPHRPQPPLAPSRMDSARDDDETPEFLRLDQVTGRVEILMPPCDREPSFMSESVRRQISFVFDEPSSPLLGRTPKDVWAPRPWVASSLGSFAAAA